MVVLKACLNGARTRDEHPAVPITPQELGEAAAGAVAAGAGALHIHPRSADERESLRAEDCDPAVEAIRAACPGVPVGLTTGAWIEPDPSRRLALVEAWSELPDFVSVNMREEGARELCALVAGRGMGIEVGLWSEDDARTFVDAGPAEGCVRILVEALSEDPGEAVASAEAIDRLLDQAGFGEPRLLHGQGAASWALVDLALARGRDIRIGLEDVLILPDGRLARDNVDLVEAALALVRRHG